VQKRKKPDAKPKKKQVQHCLMTGRMTTTQNANPANHLIFPVGLHLRQHLSQNLNLHQRQRQHCLMTGRVMMTQDDNPANRMIFPVDLLRQVAQVILEKLLTTLLRVNLSLSLSQMMNGYTLTYTQAAMMT
jgi:hypothetical protein